MSTKKIQEFVTNVMNKQYVDSERILHETMREKTAVRMDAFKQQIGKSYFGQGQADKSNTKGE